jgi:anti-sigma regulatory factor (Ser/Thr protein kinase)
MVAHRFLLEDPATFLHWLAAGCAAGWTSFDEAEVAQVFAIAATAALGRHDGTTRLSLVPGAATGASRFAHALGLREVLDGDQREPTERDRTVTLTRLRGMAETEATAKKILSLLLPGQANTDAGHLFWFVLVELLRNVVQHSNDPAGGVVAAQRNDAGPYADAPALQIVVVDNGVGVFESLRRTRPAASSPAEALTHALEPHVSGAFAPGHSGTVENAGLGLFFISEMAKLTRGRLLLASRGATYFLDRRTSPTALPVLTNGQAPDYPGTLVVFETAITQVGNYDAIIRRIHDLAATRTPQRLVQRWLRFEAPPDDVRPILVDVAAEDTVAAHAFSATHLEAQLLQRKPIALDFRNLRISTQSFLHALVHEAVRLAWARRVPMYVVNATPTIRAQLEFVESYSLGG